MTIDDTRRFREVASKIQLLSNYLLIALLGQQAPSERPINEPSLGKTNYLLAVLPQINTLLFHSFSSQNHESFKKKICQHACTDAGSVDSESTYLSELLSKIPQDASDITFVFSQNEAICDIQSLDTLLILYQNLLTPYLEETPNARLLIEAINELRQDIKPHVRQAILDAGSAVLNAKRLADKPEQEYALRWVLLAIKREQSVQDEALSIVQAIIAGYEPEISGSKLESPLFQPKDERAWDIYQHKKLNATLVALKKDNKMLDLEISEAQKELDSWREAILSPVPLPHTEETNHPS